MTKEEALKKVTEILLKYSKGDLAADSITESTGLLSDLNINSARLVDIILDFEDVFDLTIEDADADSITTVGDSVELVMKKIGV